MSFQPNEQQSEALRIVGDRIRDEEPVTRLFGYAGTGKTTMAKFLSQHEPGLVLFAAYTGKAASVLTRKGCPASTIHGLIYTPTGNGLELKIAELEKKLLDDPDNGLLAAEIRKLKKQSGKPSFEFNPETSALQGADLLVLDEVSMVDDKVARDLLSFHVPILALGDPAQLPPVGAGGYFTKGGEDAADALLTDVVRHGGAVIDLATQIRMGRERAHVNGTTVVKQIKRSDALDFDQVLVGTNKTRWAKNTTLRKLHGHGSDPLYQGERIICLANNKDLHVLNGQQFVVYAIQGTDKLHIVELLLLCECDAEKTDAPCTVCGWTPHWVPTWELGFDGMAGEEELKGIPYGKSKAAMHATYGYAITVHKAQGSEWDRVLVIDESPVFRKDGWRWLYTAVTRASSGVVVVRG